MKRFSLWQLWPLLAYFGLTCLMTWPAILHLADGIPGDGFDGWQNYWNLWWVKKALLELGTSPFFTDYLYPPNGASLLFHTLNIFNSLWTLPIQLNLGLAIAYNSVVLASFTLAGYGGYLLSLYTLARLKFSPLPGLRTAAFVGGLVFTMAPFHLAHLLGHMQVFSMIWPPFYGLWLLRTLTPTSALNGPRSLRNAALTCLFLILATLIDWYHTLYLLIFTAITLGWVLWQAVKPGRKTSTSYAFFRPVWLVLGIGLGFGLLLSPLLIPMLRAARTTPELQTGLEQSIILSADLLAFILPSEMHPLWGQWAGSIANNFSTTLSERLVFAGFVPLALATWAIIRAWRLALVKLWALISAAFFVLALGPYLHIGGKIVSLGDWPVPLPYLLLYHTVPFIGLTRSLSRYDLMVMLGLGVLVAVALAHLTNHRRPMTADQRPMTTDHSPPVAAAPGGRPFATCGRRPWWQAIRYSLPFLAPFLICFEFLAIPYPISKIDTPPFYFELAAQPGDFTIAELPMNWDRPTPMLYQTVHGKRLLTAYTSRDNPLELAWRTPVLQHWRYLGPDIIDQPLDQIAPTIFYDFNLRYIVLDYWQMPPGPERDATERWLAAALPGAQPIYADGRLKVYQSPPKQATQAYLTLGNGWGKRQPQAAGAITRTLAGSPPTELFLHHPQNQAFYLELTILADPTQSLQVFANNKPINTILITDAWSTQVITLPASTAPMLKISLQVEHKDQPVSVQQVSLKLK